MGMFRAVGSVYANMFNFSGRARRAEYWWYALFVFILGVVAQVVMVRWLSSNTDVLALANNPRAVQSLLKQDDVRQVVIYSTVGQVILVYIPYLAVTVRRLHDTGRSGWWMFKPFLLAFVLAFVMTFLAASAGGANGAPSPALMLMAVTLPMLAYIWFIVVLCLPSDRGNNRFGPDPIPDRPRPVREAGHPALVKEMDEELGRQVAAQRKAEFENYYRARVLPAIERNKSMRRT
ncbi:MAG: DUF805 domain-containing protein [Roseicyclus sp.]